MCRVIDAVYVMEKSVKETLGMKQENKNKNKENKIGESRRIKKMNVNQNDLRQAVERERK